MLSERGNNIPTFNLDKDGTSTMWLQDFSIVYRKDKLGKDVPMLRFCWVWVVKVQGAKLAIKVPGCLAYRFYNYETKEPIVVWSPPKTAHGKVWLKMMSITPDVYNQVHKILLGTKWIDQIGLPNLAEPPEEKMFDEEVTLDEAG